MIKGTRRRRNLVLGSIIGRHSTAKTPGVLKFSHPMADQLGTEVCSTEVVLGTLNW